jgi:hypothetical protein
MKQIVEMELMDFPVLFIEERTAFLYYYFDIAET